MFTLLVRQTLNKSSVESQIVPSKNKKCIQKPSIGDVIINNNLYLRFENNFTKIF